MAGVAKVQICLVAQPLPGLFEHVGRGVQARDVEAGLMQGVEKDARAAADFEQPLAPARPGRGHALQKAHFAAQGKGPRLGLEPGVVAPGGFLVPHVFMPVR